jgi:hypothetical protein
MYRMATRFRKHRSRKMNRSKSMKTRKHRGGFTMPSNLTRMGSNAFGTLSKTAKNIAVKAGLRKSNVDKMFEEEDARIANRKKFGANLRRNKASTQVNYNDNNSS